MSKTHIAVVVVTLFSTTTLVHAGDRSFKIEPGSVLSPSYRRPTPHHVEPPSLPTPPLTAFDRNMVPPGYGKPTSGVDLAEPITFGAPQPKPRH